MKVSVDTNILVRAVIGDDAKQAAVAARVLEDAETIAISLPCLCEFVWVLRRVYRIDQREISAAMLALVSAANVVVDRPAVDAGLAVLNAGGDFADGLIEFEGRWLGGASFVSFDRKAVAVLTRQGLAAHVPE